MMPPAAFEVYRVHTASHDFTLCLRTSDRFRICPDIPKCKIAQGKGFLLSNQFAVSVVNIDFQ